MDKHHKAFSAVFPIILRTIDGQKQILLLKRANTGYMDGMWDLAGSGHVDAFETAMQAIIRECKEEMGITISPHDISFAHLSHRVGQHGARTYYDMYFEIHQFCGEPLIKEPNKCSALQWFALDQLPETMIDFRKNILKLYLNSIFYSELTY